MRPHRLPQQQRLPGEMRDAQAYGRAPASHTDAMINGRHTCCDSTPSAVRNSLATAAMDSTSSSLRRRALAVLPSQPTASSLLATPSNSCRLPEVRRPRMPAGRPLGLCSTLAAAVVLRSGPSWSLSLSSRLRSGTPSGPEPPARKACHSSWKTRAAKQTFICTSYLPHRLKSSRDATDAREQRGWQSGPGAREDEGLPQARNSDFVICDLIL